MKKIISIIITLTILGSVLSGCSSGNSNPTVKDAQKWDSVTVATWGDTTVSMTDFMYFLKSTKQSYEQSLQESGEYAYNDIENYWTNSETGKANVEEIKGYSITDARHFVTLYKIAMDAGTVILPENEGWSRSAVEEERDSFSGNIDEANQLFLDAYGITPEQMIDIYDKMDIVNQYLYDLSDPAKISDDEARAEYEAYPDDYDVVTVRHILILSDDSMSAEEQEAAKVRAEEILDMVNSGEDFGSLVTQYSEDPGSVDNNGEYTFGRGEMVTEFEDWSYSAKDGETGIVKTSYGYHVMQMIGHPKYEDLIDDLKSIIGNQRADEVLQGALDIANSDEWQTNQKEIDKVKI